MKVTFPKFVVFVNSAIPLALLLLDLYRKQVGPNPLEFATRTTGMLTLVFLSLTVAITPLRRILGLNSLVTFRRMLGLFAFFYGSLHLLTYIWFDRQFNLVSAAGDVAQRPFILVGLTAFLLILRSSEISSIVAPPGVSRRSRNSFCCVSPKSGSI